MPKGLLSLAPEFLFGQELGCERKQRAPVTAVISQSTKRLRKASQRAIGAAKHMDRVDGLTAWSVGTSAIVTSAVPWLCCVDGRFDASSLMDTCGTSGADLESSSAMVIKSGSCRKLRNWLLGSWNERKLPCRFEKASTYEACWWRLGTLIAWRGSADFAFS